MEDPLKCPTCGGCGRVALADLHPELNRLLKYLRRGGPKSSSEAWVDLEAHRGRVMISALNMRLERLRKLGLVTRTKRGREWVYAASPSTAPSAPAGPQTAPG